MSVEVGSAVGYLDLDIQGFLDGLKSAREAVDNGIGQIEKASESIAISFGKNLQSIGDGMKKLGMDMAAISVPIGGAIALAAKSAIDFESAFAGVRKTVDATEEEFAMLSAGIRDMAKSLPQSAVEIAAVAEAAGQMGIQTENILEFSKTMVMLGDTTNLASADAAMALSRFANIVQMSQGDFDKLGSTIVALGNNLATTEADITAMSLRIAGAGKQVGMTEAEIVSFAGALSSVGMEAQAGGSAISKMMINMAVATKDNSKLTEILSSSAFQMAANAKEFEEAEKSYAKAGKSSQKAFDDVTKAKERVTDAQKKYNEAFDKFGAGSTQAANALDRLKKAQDSLAKRQETLTKESAAFSAELHNLNSIAGIQAPQTLRELEMLADRDAKGFKALAHQFGMTAEELKKLMAQEKNLQNFANVAGMTAEEFQKAFGEDAAGTLIAFIEGLQNVEETGRTAIEILDEMGITEIRLRDAFLRAAGAGDVFREALELGTNAWEENTALVNEAEQRYETFASRIKILTNNLTDTGITLGEMVLPYIEALMDGIKRGIELFNGLSDSVKEGVVACALLVGGFTPVMVAVGAVISAIGKLISLLASLGAAKTALVATVGTLKAAIVAFGAVLAGISAPVWIAIGVLAALGVALYALWANWDEVCTFIKEVWEGTCIIVSEWASSLLDTLKQWCNNILEFFTNLWTSVKSTVSAIWSGIVEGIQSAVSWIYDKVKGFFTGLYSIFDGVISEFVNIGRRIVEGVWQGIQNAATWFTNKVKGFFSGIVNSVQQSLGIRSPSQVFADAIGKWIPAGIAEGFEDAMPKAFRDMQAALDAGMGALRSRDIAFDFAPASSRNRSGGSWGDGGGFGGSGQQNGLGSGNTINIYSREPIESAAALRREIEQMSRTMAFGF